jgi:hypothetical protein
MSGKDKIMRRLLGGRFALVLTTAVVCCLSPWAAEPAGLVERVKVLVRQLDDQRFASRLQADQELRGLGIAVVPLLQKELDAKHPLEVSRRLESIVTELSRIPWKTETSVAQEEAGRTGKPILVFSTIGDVDGFA